MNHRGRWFGFLLWTALGASASGLGEDLLQTVRSSPQIVIARCIGADAESPDRFHFAALEVLRGRPGHDLVVRNFTSRAGANDDQAAPSFTEGRRYLLFLTPDADGGAVLLPGRSFEIAPARIGGGRLVPSQPDQVLEVTLDDVREQIQADLDASRSRR